MTIERVVMALLAAHLVTASAALAASIPDQTIADKVIPNCGDGVVDIGEQCDGTADVGCPGMCSADCTCPPVTTIDIPSTRAAAEHARQPERPGHQPEAAHPVRAHRRT